MSETLRKKDTGAPGNPGQFASTTKAPSGLTLSELDPAQITITNLEHMAAHGEVARRHALALRAVPLGHELTRLGITSLEVSRYNDGTFYASEAVNTDGETTDSEFLLGQAEDALDRTRMTFADLALISRHPATTSDTITLDPTRFETAEQVKAGLLERDRHWRTITEPQDLPAAS